MFFGFTGYMWAPCPLTSSCMSAACHHTYHEHYKQGVEHSAWHNPKFTHQSHAYYSAALQASRVADSLASAEPSPQFGTRGVEQSIPGCILSLETSQWGLCTIQLLP